MCALQCMCTEGKEMEGKKKAPLSKSERAANSRKGAKNRPWSRWNPGEFSQQNKKREFPGSK